MPSPTVISPKEIDFFSALQEIHNGKRITRLDWDDTGWYALLRNGEVQIHKPDGTFHVWAIHEADMSGLDYIVLDQFSTPAN